MRLKEAGIYSVVLPISKEDYTIVWEMWCSTMQWAVQDANCYCNEFMDDLFGKDNWQFAFVETIEEVMCGGLDLSNIELNLKELDSKRRRYHLPPWEQDKPDLFKNCFSQKPSFDFF